MGKADVDAVEIASKQRHLYLLTKVKQGQPLTKTELEELAEYEKKRKAAKKSKGGGKPDVAGIAPDQIIESTKEAAKYARVSPRTVRRWVQEGMYAGKRDGKRIYIKNVLDVYKLHHGKNISIDREREQKAQANIKETKDKLLAMDLKLRQGKQKDVETFEKKNIAQILAVKRAFLGLGRKLAPQLGRIKDPRKIQARIDEQVREIIKTFTGK